MNSKKKNDLFPVYALIGTDKLKIEYVLKRLETRLNEYGDMSFNTSIFDGENSSGAEICQAAKQMPFASEKRYILVKNAEKLNKIDNEALIDYLEQPAETTVLALVCKKLAKNTRLYKACSKISITTIIDCSPPKKYKIADSLKTLAKNQGSSIDYDAAIKLVELVGEDTMLLDNEIKKLLLANKNTNITEEQVILQVSQSSDIKPWEFTNSFAERNLEQCLTQFKNMKDGSEFAILPQTCKIIKELICVQDLGANATQNIISQELGYESWRVKNHYRWSQNFSKKELVSILEKALDCEIKMKSTSNSALAFESFIIESLRR